VARERKIANELRKPKTGRDGRESLEKSKKEPCLSQNPPQGSEGEGRSP